MNNYIFQLAINSINDQVGYVFLNEIPESFYTTDIWAVASKELTLDPSKLLDEYVFIAVEENEEKEFILKRHQEFIYFVEHPKYGKILFAVEYTFPYTLGYIGRSNWFAKDTVFYEVIPISVDKINDLCLNNRFFFVGRVDEEMRPE